MTDADEPAVPETPPVQPSYPHVNDEHLDVLRSLDWERMNAFRTEHGLGGPRKPPDKVLLLMHKERLYHPGITAEEKAASQAWIDERTARGQK